jgi:arylsulfatase A-like enzyme
VFVGAEVRGGTVVRESDDWAGYPASEAYMPADITATIYDALGIDPRTEVVDIQDRPMVVNEGHPIDKLFTGAQPYYG